MNDLTLYSKLKFSVRILLDKVFSKKKSDPTIIDVVPLKPKRKIDYLFPVAKYIQRLARFVYDLGFALGILTCISGVMGAMFLFMAKVMDNDNVHYTTLQIIGFWVGGFIFYSTLMALFVYVLWELYQVWKWLKKWAKNYDFEASKRDS